MCMTTKMSIKDKKQWLSKKPEMITAYKEVKIKELNKKQRLFSPYQGGVAFKRNNVIEEELQKPNNKVYWIEYENSYKPARYVAYFHLFANKKSAKTLCDTGNIIIKCKIPKKAITDIGTQWDRKIIVTKEFSIVEQNEYLKEYPWTK